jgi:ribonuclease HI
MTKYNLKIQFFTWLRLSIEFWLLNALSVLAVLNEVSLIWVLGHCDILGNEEANRLALQASTMPLPGPEPTLGIPKCSEREAVRTWTENQHHNT